MSDKPQAALGEPPTEAELDKLELFLDTSEPEPGLPLDALDGLLTCIICSPGPPQPSTWMQAVWGGNPPEFPSADEGKELMDILMKLYNHIVRQVNEGNPAPMVTTYEDESGEEFDDPQDWCLGFIEGMRLQPDVWERRLDRDESLARAVAPILEIAEPSDETKATFETPEGRDKMIDDLCSAIIEIRDYWHDHPVEG